MSIEKTEGYQSLLNYWEGNGPTPTAEYATEVLMDLTEKLKAENCLVQRDVIDAMLRQPHLTTLHLITVRTMSLGWCMPRIMTWVGWGSHTTMYKWPITT